MDQGCPTIFKVGHGKINVIDGEPHLKKAEGTSLGKASLRLSELCWGRQWRTIQSPNKERKKKSKG